MTRQDFCVPYKDKDRAKALGAAWDAVGKTWFAPDAIVASRMEGLWPGPKRYFQVDYQDNAKAKALGAQWDWRVKGWYADLPGPQAKLQARFLDMKEALLDLHGEDIEYGGNSLYVDLVPSSAWAQNVRDVVSNSDWCRLRNFARDRAHWRCEICDAVFGKGKRARTCSSFLEVHERWSYDSVDQRTGIMVLKRLVAMCTVCHQVTHLGRAELMGQGQAAMSHLMHVRGCNVAQAMEMRAQAERLFNLRSLMSWQLDLTMLSDSGVAVVDKPVTK